MDRRSVRSRTPRPAAGDPGFLDRSTLAALADAGWEVANHGQRHRRLDALRLAAPVAAGDRRVRVAGAVYPESHHGLLAGDDLEVTDGDRTAVRTVAGLGEDDDASVVEFERPLESAIDPAATVVRPTEAVPAEEVRGAARALREAGFDPRPFVFPYDAADRRAWRLGREHHDAAANSAVRSLPNRPGTPLSDLRRCSLETDAATTLGRCEHLDPSRRRAASASWRATARGTPSPTTGRRWSSRPPGSGASR